MEEFIKKIKREFKTRFQSDFVVIKAPGRVNLIGEHTDYNDGFVLPAAIDKAIWLVMNLNDTGRIRLFSVDMNEEYSVELSPNLEKSGMGWPDYILGVVDQLRKHGMNSVGFDCVFGGNVPIGAGLSSSAALEGGVLYGLAELNGWEISLMEMAQIAQKAENEFVGVQCGIMDQFASLNGKEAHALKLDCRTLEFEKVPFRDPKLKIVLCDTGVRRELAGSEYNIRRAQCERGVSIIQKSYPQVRKLRDVTMDMLYENRSEMDEVVFRRCKFVIEENQRVLDSCDDLERDDIQAFGQRMFKSHDGLQHDYEVSCKELDILVDIAKDVDGTIGSRMMGGGFGGCTINLVRTDSVELFADIVKEKYRQQTGKVASVYVTTISEGTHLLKHDVHTPNGL
ncbi:galactokinase [Rhodohalobacter barkolensis]|uniref:Galactokinase n=1 Tax=Rhodohalobacter barkolensis TaxID=2053187 RepID=A0A2N0VIM3_9BACT|nr:galactokinase [Rhodohalobacter barkolensis]PKD44036.1 galactokinase [Rhodohalobacter barkolensis]